MSLRMCRQFLLFVALLAFIFHFICSLFAENSYIFVEDAGLSWVNGVYIPSSFARSFVWAQWDQKLKHFPDVFELGRLHPEVTDVSAFISKSNSAWMLLERDASEDKAIPVYINEGRLSGLYPPREGWKVAGEPGQLPPPTTTSGGKRLPNPSKESKRGGGKNVKELLAAPITLMLLIANLYAAYLLWEKRVPVGDVSFSLAAFMDGEYWRVVTASFSHFEFMHLGFNMISLYNFRYLEQRIGSFNYLYLSLDLVVVSMLIYASMYYFLWKYQNQQQYRAQQSVGYSCVLFAWMVVDAVKMEEFCPVPGFAQLCFKTYHIGVAALNAGPFMLLILTNFIMPKASFHGHLSGILLGYLISWGLLQHLSTPLLVAICLCMIITHQRAWMLSRLPDYVFFVSAQALQALNQEDRRTISFMKVLLSVQLVSFCFQCFMVPIQSLIPDIFLAALIYRAMQAHQVARHPDAASQHHQVGALLVSCLSVMCYAQGIFQFLYFSAIVTNWTFLKHAVDATTVELCVRTVLASTLALIYIFSGFYLALTISTYPAGCSGIYSNKVLKFCHSFQQLWTLSGTIGYVSFQGQGHTLAPAQRPSNELLLPANQTVEL